MTRKTTVMVMAMFVIGLLAASVAAGPDKMAITTSSDEARAEYLKGRDMFERLRFPEARAHLEKAVQLDPQFPLGHLLLAQAGPSTQFFVEHLNQARAHMDKATDAEQWWIKAVAAGFEGQPNVQLKMFTKMAEAYPNDVRVRTLLGNLRFGRQEWDEAIEQYEAAIKTDPSFHQVYNQLGYSYRFLGQYDDAERVFKKYIELIPDDPNPYDSYAELLMKMGRYEESIKQYQRALKLDPGFVASYTGIAHCNDFLGKYDQALEATDQLKAHAVNSGQQRAAHFCRMLSYVDQGRYDKAIGEVEMQMKIAKKNNDPATIAGDHVTIAILLLENYQFNEARQHFDRARDIVQASSLSDDFKKNNELNYLGNVAMVAVYSGDIETARKYQKEFAAGAQKTGNVFQKLRAHHLAGQIAMQAGDYETALAELQQANLQDTYCLYRIGLCYEKLGETELARQALEQAAGFNQLNTINYRIVRHEAARCLTAL